MTELPTDYPPIDFNTFVLSLSTSALISLGEIADPSSGLKDANRPMAKQTLELLELLESKTRGNLSGEEERLLGQLLDDLRARYAASEGLEEISRSSKVGA